jgi:hypothetical protein
MPKLVAAEQLPEWLLRWLRWLARTADLGVLHGRRITGGSLFVNLQGNKKPVDNIGETW